jgi:hypothetical protein
MIPVIISAMNNQYIQEMKIFTGISGDLSDRLQSGSGHFKGMISLEDMPGIAHDSLLYNDWD